jgi:hypothetical protein
LFELRNTRTGGNLTNQLISTPNVANALKPLTDSKTAFVQVDSISLNVAFYFVNSLDFGQLGFFYKADSISMPDHYT